MRNKKCKICKKTFTPQRPLQMVCGYKCSHEYAKLQKQKAWKKKKKADEKKRQSENKDWKKRQKKMDIEVNPKKYRGYLNIDIQKLARLIDKKCGIVTCIDCGIHFGKQTDGGHYHSKGANATLAWNLHNIHSQASHCNQNGLGGGKTLGYFEGLQSRYSKEYADYVRYDLVRLYPSINLSNKEVYEKLKIVRKLNREIDTYKFTDPIKARDMFNRIIGIYDTPRT